MTRTLVTMLLAVVAVLQFNLGMDWVNDGYGVHPLIAFPVATVALLIPFAFKDLMIGLDEWDATMQELIRSDKEAIILKKQQQVTDATVLFERRGKLQSVQANESLMAFTEYK